MKYFFFFLLTVISCNVPANKAIDVNNNKNLENQSIFKKSLSSNSSYVLYYKIDQGKNNPVKLFTYYVADNKTNKIIKTSEQVAAENIYWKNDNTLAIVPYIEVMKQETNVEEPQKINEILISFK